MCFGIFRQDKTMCTFLAYDALIIWQRKTRTGGYFTRTGWGFFFKFTHILTVFLLFVCFAHVRWTPKSGIPGDTEALLFESHAGSREGSQPSPGTVQVSTLVASTSTVLTLSSCFSRLEAASRGRALWPCLFVYLLKAYSPANRTASPQGFYKTCTLQFT